MREEAEDRDHGLIELVDEREQYVRELWMREADRRDDFMLL